jgi:DNA adenine methylase
MDKHVSPLRYPGGKQQLSGYVKQLIAENDLYDGIYVEPYAGGAGVALDLLFSEYVRDIHLNDLDKNIYSFWYCVLNKTEELLSLIVATAATIENWNIQSSILRNANDNTPILERGFATFFLNRCNRSGIIGAGPIGGKGQKGKWKIDARYNVQALSERIKMVARYKNSITINNKDCLDFLNTETAKLEGRKSLVYLDPPYYNKGQDLYLNAYKPEDHVVLSKFLHSDFKAYNWIISYDVCQPVADLYQDLRCTEQVLNYSVTRNHKKGKEFVFYSNSMKIPAAMPLINSCCYLKNETTIERD